MYLSSPTSVHSGRWAPEPASRALSYACTGDIFADEPSLIMKGNSVKRDEIKRGR